MVHKDVTDETVGLRAFQVRKAQAVERAVERIRHRLGHGWQNLSSEEIDLLEWTLGELWAMVGPQEWDSFHFSFCTPQTVREIIAGGRQIINRERPGTAVLAELQRLLSSLQPEEEKEGE